MRLAIKGSDQAIAEMQEAYTSCEWVKVQNSYDVIADNTLVAYFQLDATAISDDYSGIEIPVFIHAVADTLQKMKHTGNVVRINGWPGFLKRNVWEVAGNTSAVHETILASLGIQLNHISDTPGFLAARVLCMVINEAFFALEEGVSTKEEIDIAMKLGTGYPMGPFEWAEKIGIHEVTKLLITLKENNLLYRPCGLLLQQINS